MLLVCLSSALAADLVAAAVSEVPLRDPGAAEWSKAAEVSVPVMPQNVAYPKNMAPSVSTLRVRALVDARWVGIRIQWEDATRDEKVLVDQHTDAVAVQIPLGDPARANPMMGAPDGPVYIAQWKAQWQSDVENGHADVQDYYPNYWADTYPFVRDGYPYPIETAFSGTDAQRYFVATSAGNPVAQLDRLWPVEELTAEGFGTLASQAHQDARAWGGWAEGRWTVVLAVPRAAVDPSNPPLQAGQKTPIGFAVWNGSAGDGGGRKHWSIFQTLVLP